MRRWAGWSATVAAVLVTLALAASSADATTFVVDTTADTGESNPSCTEPCSLRQAIADANGSAEKENRVEVPAGTFTLTQGTLEVDPAANTTETIIGRATRAKEVVIRATVKREVMNVGKPGVATGEAVVAFADITGGEGSLGGGIFVNSQSTLSVIDVAVEGNTATRGGGGIAGNGVLNVLDSVIARNTVTGGRGGGIDSGSRATVVNSTIADNKVTSTEGGGGIYNGGQLGLKMVNATIAGNEVAGGGGGLAGKPIEAFNSILAQNKPENCAVTIEDAPLGDNLSDDASCKLGSPGDKEKTPAGLVEEGGLPLLADNGGATETIALQSSSPAIGAGSELACPTTDQRNVERPKGLCDIGAFQFSKTPTSSGGGQQTSSSSTPSSAGGPPPPPPPPLPPPILARTGDVAPVSGVVLVKLPGTNTFVALSSLREVPFGTVIDATHGRVVVTTVGPHGGTQTGEFFEGEFVLTQGHNGLVVAALAGGDFAVCPTAHERSHTARAHAAHASGSHVVRKLWANAHGSFSTKGNYAAGAVAGTEWLTEDLCDGTSIRVTRDKVLVTNLVNHHHLIIKSGHSYLAKAP